MLNRRLSEYSTPTDTDFDEVVLGAGVVGINTAYWAMRAGCKVAVVDRQPAAGLETSFANGGQISVSHAEPWANPSAPLKILKWVFNGRSPLLFLQCPVARVEPGVDLVMTV
jgi:D-amino-acid dehydrogenase